MIELENFSVGYGSRLLLEDITTSFPEGSLTALIGKNGAGKSTFLRALCGLKTDYSGIVRIEGKDIRKLQGENFARSLSMVSSGRNMVPDMECKDIVALGRAPYTNWYGKLSGQDEHIIQTAFREVGMSDFFNRKFDSLSDGEAQRIMIARAISQDTPVIVLDEPTSFLDMPSRYEIVYLLKKIAHEKEKTILFSTHELDLALNTCDYIALIHDKKLIHLPVQEMIEKKYIGNLFSTEYFDFDKIYNPTS